MQEVEVQLWSNFIITITLLITTTAIRLVGGEADDHGARVHQLAVLLHLSFFDEGTWRNCEGHFGNQFIVHHRVQVRPVSFRSVLYLDLRLKLWLDVVC